MISHLIVYNSIDDREIITVHWSKEYWEKMFPKLEVFWNESLLTEILDSRVERNMEIREPVSENVQQPANRRTQACLKKEKEEKKKVEPSWSEQQEKNADKGWGDNSEFTGNSIHKNSDSEEIIWFDLE